MTPNRHCDEVSETAALYALGKLPEAEARGFERRLESGCSLCQAELETHQHTVEMLLGAIEEVAPPASLEQRLMLRIASEPPPKTGIEVLRSNEGQWVAGGAPGVSLRFLHGRKTVLVKLDPGARYPGHEHRFDENCLVLEGTVEDGENKLSAGDYLFMPAGSKHTPAYSENGCVLLIAYA